MHVTCEVIYTIGDSICIILHVLAHALSSYKYLLSLTTYCYIILSGNIVLASCAPCCCNIGIQTYTSNCSGCYTILLLLCILHTEPACVVIAIVQSPYKLAICDVIQEVPSNLTSEKAGKTDQSQFQTHACTDKIISAVITHCQVLLMLSQVLYSPWKVLREPTVSHGHAVNKVEILQINLWTLIL